MDVLVTVYCAAYNHAPYIRDTLDGFIMQKTNFPFEVIVHDDASTDGTQEIIREYEEKYPEIIKPIYQTENQYSKKVRIGKTFCDPRARGKYIAYCEGDDYWFQEKKLQYQVNYLETHPDCVLTCHPTVWVSPRGKVLGTDIYYPNECDIGIEDIIRNGGSIIPTASMVARFDIANKWPKFREIADTGDYPLVIWLALNGKCHYTPVPLACYRSGNAGSWTERVRGNFEFRLNHCISAIRWITELNRFTKGEYFYIIAVKLGYYLNAIKLTNNFENRPKLAAAYNEIMASITDDAHPEKQEYAMRKLVDDLTDYSE